MKIPTAEEFLRDYESTDPEDSRDYYDIESALISFAKLHLQAQLDSMLKIASMNINNGNVRYISLDYPGKSGKETITIDERSIKQAYPLENIK